MDDGSGKVEMWRIENFQKVAVEEDKFGQFFSGDSYIVFILTSQKTAKNTCFTFGKEEIQLGMRKVQVLC